MAANLSSFTVVQLKEIAKTAGVPGAISKLKKPNLIRAIQAIELSKVNMAVNSQKQEVAKAMFLEQGTADEKMDDADEVADDLLGSENDASTLMLSILNPRDRAHVKNTWKELVSQQVTNGSFLEFQGMRFMEPNATVYDVERNTKNEEAVLAHILQKPEPGKVKVYLKCKFSLKDVNADTERIIPETDTTWKDLFTRKLAKGQAHCEPDVIIRTSDEVRIFEMKMGLGKNDTVEKASEANQLARCKRVFENFILDANLNLKGNINASKIKLFFVGWSAPSNSGVNFTPAPWSKGPYAVTAINGTGMAGYAPINSEIVTKIITMLNVIKLENFYRSASLIFKKWSPYYQDWKKWKREQFLYVARESNKFGKAFNAPPEVAVPKKKTAAEARAAAATETGLRGKAANVRQMARRQVSRQANNSSSNSNNENAQVRRFNWVWRRTPQVTRNQRLIEQLTGDQLRALAARANTRAASRAPPINARILGLVSKNAKNWDVTYRTFLNEHANIKNASTIINTILRSAPPNMSADYANKLQKKQVVNRSRERRAALPQ